MSGKIFEASYCIFVHMQNSLYSTFSNDLVPVYAQFSKVFVRVLSLYQDMNVFERYSYIKSQSTLETDNEQ